MSISQLVPREDAELALLEEMQKEGKPIKTSELVARAIKHFPQLTPAELQRRTPSGTMFWPGKFRFYLDDLKKTGQASNRVKGYWEITSMGRQRLAKPASPPTRPDPRMAKSLKEALSIISETVKAIKRDEVKAIIRIKDNEMTIRLGKEITETTLE
jgi:hypothetical protein